MNTPLSTSRFRNRLSFSRIFFGTLLMVWLGGTGAFAQIEKAGTGTSGLGTSGANANWTGGTAPTSGQVALWDSVSTTGSQTLDAVTSWGGIQLTSVSAPVLLGPGTGGTLTLGTSGIDTSTATSGLTISAPLTLIGSQSWTIGSSAPVSVGGTFTIGGAGNSTNSVVTLSSGTVSLSAAGSIIPDNSTSFLDRLIISGGSTFTTTATFTVGGAASPLGGMFLQSSTANFAALNLPGTGNNNQFSNVTVTGTSLLNASSVTVTKGSGSSKDFQGGLLANGGTVNISGNDIVGTAGFGGSTVGGGTVNVDTGAGTNMGLFVNDGTGTTAGRGAQQIVSSGSLIVNSASLVGVTLSGSDTQTSEGDLFISGTGNVSTPVVNLGNSTTTAGTANVTMTGGTLYVGSGGIVKGGTPATTIFSVTSATVGANADFSSSVPMTISSATFQAADPSGTAHNITLSGALTSTTGLTKTGGGTLTFPNAEAFTGTVAVNAGTLAVNGSSFAAAASIASGATLAGTGTLNGTITLNGNLAPGSGGIGTLTVNSTTFTWNGSPGNDFNFDLGNSDSTSDQLAVTGTGTFTKGTGSTFEFNFGGTGNSLSGPTIYTLISFPSGNTNFLQTDFSYINLNAGLVGTFVLNATNLQLDVATVVPEPAVYGLAFGAVVMLAGWRRRRLA